ncbi:MAG: MurR/RpiR family transcriptional regulator [Pseudorhodobacter sp.]
MREQDADPGDECLTATGRDGGGRPGPLADPQAGSPTETLRLRMTDLVRSGAPGLRGFAGWLAARPEELAFHSVRSLAEAAGTDANIVMRAMKAAGYDSFAKTRKAVQQALREADRGYVARAGALAKQSSGALLGELAGAARSNAEAVFDAALGAAMEEIVPHLLAARRIHCIGVRMGYALAHYFTYRGAVAHGNVTPSPAQPGLIVDQLADCGAEDVVIVISFAHYSAEVVRAARIAHARGARVIALTDRSDSPLVQDAWRVLRAPVAGPHVMYSIAGAFLIVETLLELMAARDPAARDRIEGFESRLLELGAYVGNPQSPPRRKADSRIRP